LTNGLVTAFGLWSPDGRFVIFQAVGGMFWTRADGGGKPLSLTVSKRVQLPTSVAPNSTRLLYSELTPGAGGEIRSLPIDGASGQLKAGEPQVFLKTATANAFATFSPDGKWVAYASNETDKWEIYVTSFPEARGRWQISTGGGDQPRWRGDGKELFYLSSDAKMMAVPVRTGANFDSGSPITLFQATPRPPVLVYDLFVYDVTRDGQRFLINTPVKQAETAPMSVILNWPAKLNIK
jgi:Tol biopolymer transport system component